MSDEKKLMAVPFGMMKKTDPRTGLSAADVAYSMSWKPKSLADVPTAQEIKDGHLDDEFEPDESDMAETPDEEHEEHEEEEGRLRHFIASLLQIMYDYFCGGE